MPDARRSGHDDVREPPGAGTHTLLVGAGRQLRTGAAAWVGHELAGGSKVLYKGWLTAGATPDEHWIVGSGGAPRARLALVSGQLEFLDFPAVVARCRGTSEGLFRLQYEEVVRAVSCGWPSVAMAQESTFRPMVDEAEVAAFAEQEGRYDVLARSFPLNTLCQLAIGEERDRAVWESVATHHRRVVADRWSARSENGRWQLSGELDAAVEHEFGAAVAGALAGVRAEEDDHGAVVEVDLGGVTFLDSSCAVRLVRAAAAVQETRVVLHGCRPIVRELLDAVGRPASVRHADEVDT